jgi:uncharacterized protein DUF1801
MAKNKTQIMDTEVAGFLAQVSPAGKQADAHALDALFRRITGYEPRMWGASIIGYGTYHYTYKSGRTGDFLATGFSPRKAALSIYIMPGYADFTGILDRLGKHKIGKSCLYVNKLADIDTDALADLIRAGLADLSARWPVAPT